MTIPAPAKQLLDFIMSKEAPRGYATVYGNRQSSMPKPITSMTVDEVIADGPRRTRQYGSSAAGGPQFMTATLQSLKQTERLTGSEVMTPALQDRLGYALLLRRGYARFMAGQLSVAGFGLGLAQEWASFPILKAQQGQRRWVARGQSYYAGDGLNKALVSAGDVEEVLNAMRPASALGIMQALDEPVLQAPRAEIVPASVATENLPWWSCLLGAKPKLATKKTPSVVDRPGLRPGGSAALYDVQVALRERNYYTKIGPDGLDGPFTQSAVAQSRKDNGLGDGGIDRTFMDALPGMPRRPVPIERAQASLRQAAKEVPEVFKPLKWVGSLGLGAIGLGGADSSGLLNQVQSGAARVNDVAGSVQSAFGVFGTGVAFVVEHKGIILLALGAYVVIWAAGKALDGWIKVRQAFF